MRRSGSSLAAVLRPRPSCALLAACLCLAVASSAAAQRKPNIANDVEKKSLPRDSEGKPVKESRPARRNHPAPRRIAANLLTVTFVTGVAGADIYLGAGAGAQKIGQTGPDGRLVARLPRGTHSVTAWRTGQPAVRQQVDVQPGRTTFAVGLSNRSAAGSAVAAATPTLAASAEEVFGRFLDPRQTDQLTLAHWQSAQQQTAAAYSVNPHDPLNAAQAHFATGQLAYMRGDYASALVSFNNSALALPNSALAFYGLGNAYLATNQTGQALRAYQQAAKLNTTLAMAYKGLGDALARQGKEKEALANYEQARTLGYAPPAMETAMARSLLRLRRWQQALKLLQEIARARPSAEVYIGMGDSYAALKETAAAVAAYRQAAQADPKSAPAHFKYGELSFQLHEYAAAMEALERALALDPAGATFNRTRAREMADRAAARLGGKK